MWSDLVAAFVFGLYAIPFCGGFVPTVCTDTAHSTTLFFYALGLVPLAALGKHLAESGSLSDHAAKLVPPIMGYVVGWAVGNAIVQLLTEVKATHPELCGEEYGCTPLNLTFTVSITMLCALLVIGLQPYTQEIECGEGRCVDFMEDWLEDFWALVSRGASATTMSLWYMTSSEFATAGTENATAFAQLNLLVCFALVCFFVGSMLSVALEHMEEELREKQKASSAPWRGSLIRFSDILQSILGYVAGSMISDVMFHVFGSLSQGPTVGVLTANTALTAFWTVGMAAYLARTGEATLTTDRSAVERYFVVLSASFLVGGMWLVVARDVVTDAGVLIYHFGTLWDLSVESAQLLSVVIACPTLTVLCVGMQKKLAEKMEAAGADGGKGGPAARAASEKEEMKAERAEKKRSAMMAAQTTPARRGPAGLETPTKSWRSGYIVGAGWQDRPHRAATEMA